MLNKIKHYVARGASSLIGTAVFIFMLPLTLSMMLLVLLLGVAAKATLANRLRKSGVDVNNIYSQAQKKASGQKPPIEGSYTIVDK